MCSCTLQAWLHSSLRTLPCRPSCFRFPRGTGVGLDLASEGIAPDLKGTPLPVSSWGHACEFETYACECQWRPPLCFTRLLVLGTLLRCNRLARCGCGEAALTLRWLAMATRSTTA